MNIKKKAWPFTEFFSISSTCFFPLFYTQDLHILPSNEITMIDTSSWYFLRSPCGISSNSWKSIPVYHHHNRVNKHFDYIGFLISKRREKRRVLGGDVSYQLSLQPETEVIQPDVEPGLLQVAMRWKVRLQKQLLHLWSIGRVHQMIVSKTCLLVPIYGGGEMVNNWCMAISRHSRFWTSLTMHCSI